MPVSQMHYRRLIAYFLDPLQEPIACFWDPFTLTISAYSAISKLKGRVWSEIKFILKDGRTYPETAAIIFFFEKFVFVVRQVVRPA